MTTVPASSRGEAAPIPIADLASYPADASKFLRGDGAWAAAGGLTLLYDSGVLGAGAQIIDTGANGVAQTATHLLIFAMLRRSDAIIVATGNLIQFNNDTAGNYNWQNVAGASATAAAGAGAADVGINFTASGGSASANHFGFVSAWVPFYTGAQMKELIGEDTQYGNDAAANFTRRAFGGQWKNTAAITRVAVNATAGVTWVAGSRVMIYGI